MLKDLRNWVRNDMMIDSIEQRAVHFVYLIFFQYTIIRDMGFMSVGWKYLSWVRRWAITRQMSGLIYYFFLTIASGHFLLK